MADTDWTWSIKFADFDNDGWVDLFVSNGMTREWFNSDLRAEALERGEVGSAKNNRFWEKQPKLAEPNLAFRNLDLAIGMVAFGTIVSGLAGVNAGSLVFAGRSFRGRKAAA